MKKQQLDHVLRAAGRITGERQFIIIGSQSLHGKHPDVADEILKSAEVDLIAGKQSTRTEWLNAIGYLSPFHESFGYYADPVDLTSAALAQGWKQRLVTLPAGDTEGVRGLCLEPHDLAIAKYVASREKDLIFNRELARRGLIAERRLLELVDETPVDQSVRARVRGQIARDFHIAMQAAATHERNEQAAHTPSDWLRLRGQAGVPPAGKEPTHTRDLDDLQNSDRPRDVTQDIDDESLR
jgi:hypothetical protein